MGQNSEAKKNMGPWARPFEKLRSIDPNQAELCWLTSRTLWRLMPVIETDTQLEEIAPAVLEEILEAVLMCGLAGLAKRSSQWEQIHALVAHAALIRVGSETYETSGSKILSENHAAIASSVSMLAEMCVIIAIADRDVSVEDVDLLLKPSVTYMEKLLDVIAGFWDMSVFVEAFELDLATLVHSQNSEVVEPLWRGLDPPFNNESAHLHWFRKSFLSPLELNSLDEWNEFASHAQSHDRAAATLLKWSKVSQINPEGTISVQGFLGQAPLIEKDPSDVKKKPAGKTKSAKRKKVVKKKAPPSSEVRSILVGQQSILTEEEDSLAHRHAANAVVDFVESDETQLPLTISVEGEWGTGKSSFMNLIRTKLNREDSDFVTVWFNPWRYETVEAMWAAFAISITDQMRENSKIGWFKRVKIWLLLHWRRFRAAKKTWPVIKFLLTVILFAGVVSVIPLLFAFLSNSERAQGAEILKGILALPFVVVLIPVLKKLFQWTGNPLNDDIKSYFRSPDYGEKATLLQRFHSDVRRIMVAYADGKKIALFMDDLDRCEVPVATEILRTLNLFLAVDQDENPASISERSHDEAPEMICFIGMDREKVAASISLQHQDLLEFLKDAPTHEQSQPLSKQEQGLCFGFNYLEKFIHLTVTIPQPDVFQMADFLDTICGVSPTRDESTAVDGPITDREKIDAQEKAAKPVIRSGGSEEDEREERRSFLDRIRLTRRERKAYQEATSGRREEAKSEIQQRETELVRLCTEVALPVLGYNPRRVKQFVNLFRLRIRMAAELGFFLPGNDSRSDDSGLTMEQIGKLVAIELGLPRLFAAIRQHPYGFKQEVWPKELGEAVRAVPDIDFFLEVPHHSDVSESERRWSLKDTDLSPYFRIGLPPRKTFSE